MSCSTTVQVAFDAESPRYGSAAAPTPHPSHGLLQRGFNDILYDMSDNITLQPDNGFNQNSPDRSVSFKVACGRNVCSHLGKVSDADSSHVH